MIGKITNSDFKVKLTHSVLWRSFESGVADKNDFTERVFTLSVATADYE